MSEQAFDQPPFHHNGQNRANRGQPNRQPNPPAQDGFRGRPPQNRQQKRGPPRPSTKTAPPTLPPPTKLHDASHVKITEVSTADISLFSLGVRTREVAPLETFSPMNPSLMDVSRTTYKEITTDVPTLENTILPEYMDYYFTAIYWLRAISLKEKNSQEMTQQEKDISRLTRSLTFCLPEPLFLEVRQTGNVLTPLRQHLKTKFPPLPHHILQGHGGYFGATLPPDPGVNNTIHNLYEELPCLGVAAAAIRAALSDMDPGPYQSAVTFQGLQPNSNLVGFRDIGFRSNEAKILAQDCGITDQLFPSYPNNTSFNLKLITSMSNILAKTDTFKNSEVVFENLTDTGAQSQLIITHPEPTENSTCSRGEQVNTSITREATSVYGSATFFNSQLIKENGLDDDPGYWCLFSPTEEIPIPQPWIENRNIRRNLPPR